MYEFIDDYIETIKKNIKAYFYNSRLSILKYDEINVSGVNKEIDALFDKIDTFSHASMKREILALSRQYGFPVSSFSDNEILERYNPTTLYVFNNELERKRERYKEGAIATLIGNSKTDYEFSGKLKFPRDVIIPSMVSALYMKNQQANINNIVKQIEETSVDAERYMFLENGKREDEEYVKWLTEQDDRVCSECEALDGIVFHIDEVPERPHIGCRCTLEFVSKEEYEQQTIDFE